MNMCILMRIKFANNMFNVFISLAIYAGEVRSTVFLRWARQREAGNVRGWEAPGVQPALSSLHPWIVLMHCSRQ